jgi:cephalosporin hydroxylase
MPIRSTVKKAVRPVVGERAWRALKRTKRAISGAGTNSSDLNDLAVRFRTDKWGAHRYTQHYQRYLQQFKNDPINLLEIGIGGYSRAGKGGASLRMWKQFFPRAHIYGVDIEDKSFVDAERITTFIGDQSDPASLLDIAERIGRLDVIIDDGSHRSPHVITTFRTLFPLLRAGGIYAVEDTQSSYWPEWQGSEDLHAPATSMSMLKALADGLNFEEFVTPGYEPSYTDRNVVAVHFFHNLTIIEKGPNAEGSNKKKVLKARYGTSAGTTAG